MNNTFFYAAVHGSETISLKKLDATKGLFRGRKSKKDRQYNDNREKNNSLQTTAQIPKD